MIERKEDIKYEEDEIGGIYKKKTTPRNQNKD